ncbi:MAG TPA: hypothetical protein QF571_10250, partial [Desulfobacterales bacterium]|nr:hypothetical protein [Desulfobacterales bacterium]
EKFALIRKTEKKETTIGKDFLLIQVQDVLVNQLGYLVAEAKQMIAEAMKRNRNISTPEELVEEIYHGEVS